VNRIRFQGFLSTGFPVPLAVRGIYSGVTLLALTVILGLGALLAGFLGALTGLGGGIVIVPLLTLGFGVDIRYAVGTSLIAVIATSSGAAAAYVKEGFTNLRVGMLLEVGTVTGALAGAFIAQIVSGNLIGILFAVTVLFTAAQSLRAPSGERRVESTPLARKLRLSSSYPTPHGLELMVLAGCLSALLGIGAGIMKVLAMDRAMGLPFKVSTTTSNFMIGVTAAASAGVYLQRGYIDPGLVFPVVVGVLAGAWIGSLVFQGASTRVLRLLFLVVVTALAVQMLYRGVTGGFQ
jgi:uncharacterized membrane protein YfcA